MRILILVGLIFVMPMATHAQNVKFGTNTSEWARDGVCDDVRFVGRGMDPKLRSEDIGRDATDCKSLCLAGTILLRDY
jgi:hypothetical protein